VITRDHEALLAAESSQISAWIERLVRLEIRDPHILAMVDLRSPIGLSVAIAATDTEHARAHLVVRLERDELPSFSCVFESAYAGPSQAVRHVLDLHREYVGELDRGFVCVAAIDEFDSVGLGLIVLDRRSSGLGQIEWRGVRTGRDPDPPPGRNETPW
jgi:hypothetical protein